MRISRKSALAVLTAMTLTMAACGGDDDDTAPAVEPTADSDGDASADSDGDTSEPAGEPVAEALLDGEIPCEQQYAGKSVSIFSPVRDSENDSPTVDLVNAYQPLVDCTGVEIVWQGTDQFETEINVRLQGGDPPDVIDYPQPGLMAQHARQELIVPLPDDVAAHLDGDYIPGWETYSTVDGTAYALPGRSNIKSLVWYDPAAFAEAGYEIPTTFDGLVTLSDQMVNHEIPFNDPQVVAVVDAVGAFVKNADYLGGENNVKAIATTKFQDGGLPILSGDCYMHRQASFYSALCRKARTLLLTATSTSSTCRVP